MKKILIWGTGNIARQVLDNQISGEIIGFIETHKSAEVFRGRRVYTLDEIPKEYDFILVASSFVNEIYRLCLTKNVLMEKVIFLKGMKKQEGFSNIDTIREILGEKNFGNYCGEFGIVEHSFFMKDVEEYRKLNKRKNFEIQEQYMWPVIEDRYLAAGAIGNYFWQDLWAARLIIKSKVKAHFDIGSRLDGFIAHLLAVNIQVTMIDVREFPGEVEGLSAIVDDATSLSQIQDDSIESMSALCSLEHFGLGRYGDTVDPEACFKCFDNIQRKLRVGGQD